ncbi:MAG: hypothetical protein K1X33_06800 [Methanobacteriaceae archaeon]|nr:hypothetical protein [Methanobacteriaceae archaeon]
MNAIILAASYALSGFFMKFSDDEFDEKNNRNLAIFLGIICGIFAAYATVTSMDAAYIFIGILVGNLLAMKVDGVHHIATLLTFLIIVAICGIPGINGFILLACLLGAWIDELGNDNPKVYSKGKFFEYFFDYRFTMKVVILLLALFGFLQLISFVYFILFELSYELARYLFEKYLVSA